MLSFNHAVKSRNRWDSQPVELAVKDRGVYLVEAVRGELRAYTILMISDLVMVTKTGNGRIVNFLADRATGEPVRGAQIFLLARDARKATAESDATGLAEIPLTDTQAPTTFAWWRAAAPITPSPRWRPTPSKPAASTGWATSIPTVRSTGPGTRCTSRASCGSARPAGYTMPAGKSLAVEIQDAEQKPVYRKTLTANANGTVRDDFTLPPSSALGSYSINVRTGEESYMNGSFEVEEYKKPEYEVRVTATKPRILEGEPAQAVIDSRYYFGEPVAGAKVKYAVYRGPLLVPALVRARRRCRARRRRCRGTTITATSRSLDEEGTLDSEGKLAIQFDTTVSDRKTDYRYRIEARVTDEGKREIVGRGSVIATYGSFVVNARPDRYFYQPGSRAAVTVEARDYDFKPVRTRIHVELFRWTWRSRQGSGTLVSSTDVDTGADGIADRRRGDSRAGRLLPRARDGPHAGRPRRGAGGAPLGVGRRRRAISATPTGRRCRSSRTRKPIAPARRRRS